MIKTKKIIIPLCILLTTSVSTGCSKINNKDSASIQTNNNLGTNIDYENAKNLYFKLTETIERNQKLTLSDINSIIEECNISNITVEDLKDESGQNVIGKIFYINKEKITINTYGVNIDENTDISPGIQIKLYSNNKDILSYDSLLDLPIFTTSKFYENKDDYFEVIEDNFTENDTLEKYLDIIDLLDDNNNLKINNIEYQLGETFEEMDSYELKIEPEEIDEEMHIQINYSLVSDDGSITITTVNDEITLVSYYNLLTNGFADKFEYYNSKDFNSNMINTESEDKTKGYYINIQKTLTSEQKEVLNRFN